MHQAKIDARLAADRREADDRARELYRRFRALRASPGCAWEAAKIALHNGRTLERGRLLALADEREERA